jgi:hypothetical protein
MTSPRPEAVAAADWWAQQLAAPADHEIGSPTQTAFANAATTIGRNPKAPEQIEAFRAAAADAIEGHVSQYEWRPDEPLFGSYMRTITCDYGPDPLLADAAERAGFKLSTLDLPMKTVMWVNPGKVSVAVGHGGGQQVVWQGDE